MKSQVEYEGYWAALWHRLLADQSRLYDIQQADFSGWRARKLLALRDSERVFYEVDDHRSAKRMAFDSAWLLFTDELVQLYLAAARRSDEPYAAGLAVALACQRGHHPEADPPPMDFLIVGQA